MRITVQEAVRRVLDGEYQNDGPVYRCDIGRFQKTSFHFFMWHRGELPPDDAMYEWDDKTHQGWIGLGFDRHGEAAFSAVDGTDVSYGWLSYEITTEKVMEAINTIIDLKSTYEVMGS